MTTYGGVAGWPRRARVFRSLAVAVLAAGTTLFVVGFLVGSRDAFALAIGIIFVGVPTLYLSLMFGGLAVVFAHQRPSGTARPVALVVIGALCASIGLLAAAANLPGIDAVSVAFPAVFFALGVAVLYFVGRLRTAG